MLCCRQSLQSLQPRLFLSRNVSTQQNLLNTTHAMVSGHIATNPITRRPTLPSQNDFDGPPRAGPQGYTTPKDNPMSRTNTSQYATIPTPVRSAYRFDCHSTRNNTITTLSSLTYPENVLKPPESKVIAWFSGGSVGFKKGQRAGYEAGYQCAVRVFKLLEELKDKHGSAVTVDLYFNGFGQGREALKTALMASEGDKIRDTIKNVIDRTALKIGGTRSKKTRRL